MFLLLFHRKVHKRWGKKKKINTAHSFSHLFYLSKACWYPSLISAYFPLDLCQMNLKHSIIKIKVKIISHLALQRQPKEGLFSLYWALDNWLMSSGFRQLYSIQRWLFAPLSLYSILNSASECAGWLNDVYRANKRYGSHKCLLILVQA